MKKSFRSWQFPLRSLGPLERAVLNAAWALGSWVTVNDVIGHPTISRRNLAYSTIKAVMQRLTDKALLEKRSAGKANIFRPSSSRAQFESATVKQYVDPLFDRYRNPMLARIAEFLVDDESALQELEDLVARKRGKNT